MKRTVFLARAASGCTAIVFFLLAGQVRAQTPWNIVWSDEFNGTSINEKNWAFENGNNNGWGNMEWEFYTRNTNNAYVDGNGLLHIVALQQSMGGFNFTSARMKTQGLFNTPTYGRLQWRAALPTGVGMWPALWLLGSDYPSVSWPTCGEIDVVENNGAEPFWVQGSRNWSDLSSATNPFVIAPDLNQINVYYRLESPQLCP